VSLKCYGYKQYRQQNLHQNVLEQELAQTVQYQVATTTYQTDNNGKTKYSNMTVYYKQYKLYKHNLKDLEKLKE